MVKKKSRKLGSKKNQKQTGFAEKTEKILLTMPRIIATQIGKDLLVRKQQENRLKLELKKGELQKRALLGKIATLKKKGTAAAKKQASTAQKILQKTAQTISTLLRDLKMVEKQHEELSQKKAKYTALQTQLLRFQKDWAKKASGKPEGKVNIKAKNKKMPKKEAFSQSPLKQNPGFPQAAQALGVLELPEQVAAEFAEEEVIESVS